MQKTLTRLDDRAIVDYLTKNPEFFIRNAYVVEAMRVPYPVRSTTSLVEWHMTHARNHIHVLEENMALLIERAIANEGLFYRLLYLQRSFTVASNPDDILMRFHHWTRDLGLVGTSLRLFPDHWCLGAPSNYTRLALSRQSFESLRIQRLGRGQYYLGLLNGPELLVVLPEAKAAGSVAISVLGGDADLDVVLLTSRGASHYQQGQRIQLLHETVLVLPELLARWIGCV